MKIPAQGTLDSEAYPRGVLECTRSVFTRLIDLEEEYDRVPGGRLGCSRNIKS